MNNITDKERAEVLEKMQNFDLSFKGEREFIKFEMSLDDLETIRKALSVPCVDVEGLKKDGPDTFPDGPCLMFGEVRGWNMAIDHLKEQGIIRGKNDQME